MTQYILNLTHQWFHFVQEWIFVPATDPLRDCKQKIKMEDFNENLQTKIQIMTSMMTILKV